MELLSEIRGIKYQPLLCRKLAIYSFKGLEKALETDGSFFLQLGKCQRVAISWWVSAKRTRSYPYARIYDTLGFSGKKITIIPIFKDEGLDGDRDFLQWDTISLMSLLGIYVIVAYYKNAKKNIKYENKITNQRFDISYLKREIKSVLAYQSDALHWNLAQIDRTAEIAGKALRAYSEISKQLRVTMHSKASAEKRIQELIKGKDNFMKLSRTLAQKAQQRESRTVQPKEFLSGEKALITIKNYLGGYYYLTVDEYQIFGDKIYLIEAKHSRHQNLPSLEDIKDGLVKMILFTNLEKVEAGGRSYKPVGVLKLTSEEKFNEEKLTTSQKDILKALREESKLNNFVLKMGQ